MEPSIDQMIKCLVILLFWMSLRLDLNWMKLKSNSDRGFGFGAEIVEKDWD